MTAHTGTEISSLRIGTVTAVRGRRIEITVDVDKNDSSLIFQGEIISNVSIGSFLIVRRGYAHLAVQVEEEELIENNAWENSTYQRDVDRNTRILKTTLLGEFQTDTSISPFQTRFVSGSQTSPLIGNIAYVASAEQASKIYTSSSTPGTQITIGHLVTNSLIPISLNIATLFTGHIGIFGNTGSGKSYTLSKIYTQLFELLHQVSDYMERLSSTRFIIFDFTGEYCKDSIKSTFCNRNLQSIFGTSEHTNSLRKSIDLRIPLDRNVLQDSDLWARILEADSSDLHFFIRKALSLNLEDYDIFPLIRNFFHLYFKGDHYKDISIDSLFRLLKDINEVTNPQSDTFYQEFYNFKTSLKFNTTTKAHYIQSPHGTIYESTPEFKQHVDDFFDQISPKVINRTLSPLDEISLKFRLTSIGSTFARTIRTSDIESLLTRLDDCIYIFYRWFDFISDDLHKRRTLHIINLENATFNERQLIPLIVTHEAYNRRKKGLVTKEGYLNIIIDEAHNILSLKKSARSFSARNRRSDIFDEIIREGRKFDTFLTIVSQRPSDISSTITSQLDHYFLHRLVNPADLECVKNSVVFLNTTSFEAVPSLPCGTCVVAGTNVQIPTVVKIDELPEDRRPDNETIDLVKLWGLARDSHEDAGSTAADSADSQYSESAADEL